jgi:hypothetical protein
MKHALETLSSEALAAYILMDRISPQPFEAILVRNGESQTVECTCELGIFTTFVAYVAIVCDLWCKYLICLTCARACACVV